MAATKEGVVRSPGLDEEESWALSRELAARIRDSEDMAEGIAAFFEDRAPDWPGR